VDQQGWWDALSLPASERLRARQDLASLGQLTGLIIINEVAAELARLSVPAPRSAQVPFLIQLPGVGLITALTVLAAIGEISRFPSAKALVGYSGLGARVHASSQTKHTGGITKQGRREMRTALIAAAWVAVRVASDWKERHEQLAARLGTSKAIPAIARKLLVIMWHVLSKAAADQAADPSAVARSIMLWGTKQRVVSQQGLSRAAFVRERLEQVGLGGQLQEFHYNGQVFKLSDADAQLDRSPHREAEAVASGEEMRA
jgi:hypothetical protein